MAEGCGAGEIMTSLTAGMQSLAKSLLVPENLTALLSILAECLKEFTSKITSIVGDAVTKINELGVQKIKITLEAKSVCREFLKMLLLLSTYMKKVNNFSWYAKREERKATILDALRQDEPNIEPLNEYLEQLMRCLERAEACFKKFEDHCTGKNIAERLSAVQEGFKGEADKAKLAEAITKGAGGAFSAFAISVGAGTGGVVTVSGIVLSVVAGVPTLGIGTVIGLAITGTVAPIAGVAVGSSAAGLTHVIATEFKDRKKALLLLGMCIGEISSTATDVHQTAEKLQQGLKDIVEHVEDIEYFASSRDSQLESVIKFFEELEKFAAIASKCESDLALKQQELENSISKVIGM